MLTPPETASRSRPSRLHPRAIAIIVTVALHLLLALFAAIRSVLPAPEDRPELVAEMQAPEKERTKVLEKQEVQKRIEQTLAQAPPMRRVVRTEALASMAIPEMTNLLEDPIGLGEGDLGVGFGNQRTTRMGRGAMFFGQRVTGRLGVVFDVSGSMHDFVPIVIDEINRAFRQATVVCCNPASLVPLRGKPEAVPYREADRSKCNLPSTFTEAGRAMNEDLMGLPNCWFLLRASSNLGGGIEYLFEDGATSIFVFSDFQDTIDPEYLETLVAEAQRRKVRINLQVLEKARYQKQELQELCKRTGGTFAEGELLNRARTRR